MDALNRLSAIIQEAGFDAFAITSAAPLEHLFPLLEEAKEEGRYSDFADPDLPARINPRALQGSAQSVITVAMAYGIDPGPAPPLCGALSRSAWGLDYHTVMNTGMDQVIAQLKTDFGAQECSKAVDTSVLMDRGFAAAANLGYSGSNCCIFIPPFGSWVFLGEILVDLELPNSIRQTDHHWSCPPDCTLCIEACPTKALLAPGKIDPRRCLSYHTQMSGPIPPEFRDKLGNRLWGCDTCQAVCPRNRKASSAPHDAFKPLIAPHLPLIPLLELDKRQFGEQFGPTSLAWRGKNILQRNACLILGNQGAFEALPILQKTLDQHPSPIVQEAAGWALEKIVNQR